MLIGKQLIEKVDELEKLGHNDLFILSACGYESFESFDHAYFEATTPPSELKEIRRHQEAVLVNINNKKEELALKEKIERKEALIRLKEKKQKQSFIVKGKYLATVDKQLTGKYSDEEIAIACGYYETKDNVGKVASIKNYFEARETSRKRNEFALISVDELNIFKERLIISDEEHGGTIYISKRIVEQSKEWDYSKADLKDWNIENIVNERFPSDDELPDFLERANCTKEDATEYKKDLEKQAQQLIDLYSFDEPMKYIRVDQHSFLNQYLEPDRWFDFDEIAELYGLRGKDCDAQSTFGDG